MKTLLRLLVLFAAMLLAYSNHWHNTFHFDDWHTITQNKYVRQVTPVKFFKDGATSSTLPTNQNYRPLNTLLLSIDYKLGGYNVEGYHVQSFAWFVLLVVLIYFFFEPLLGEGAAMFGAAVFGLHPACAETVNYICQRGEIVAACGVMAACLIMWYAPLKSRTYDVAFAILAVTVASFAKITALCFCLIVVPWQCLLSVIRKAVPQWRATVQWIALGVFVAGFQMYKTPPTYVTGSHEPFRYWLTQPLVALHYVKQFILPTELSADTDRELVPYLFHEQFFIGAAFIAFLLWFIWDAWKVDGWERRVGAVVWNRVQSGDLSHLDAHRLYCPRIPAFGVAWFLVCMIPTSLAPLGEAENDHRMFMPMIGLCLVAAWVGNRIHNRWPRYTPWAAGALLGLMMFGVHQRNYVWHNEETLWTDAVIKSPHNGRALMNYGLVVAAKGDYQNALKILTMAEYWTPTYSVLILNQGEVLMALGRFGEADERFTRAIRLNPHGPQEHWHYSRFLRNRGRAMEADAELKVARDLGASWVDSL